MDFEPRMLEPLLVTTALVSFVTADKVWGVWMGREVSSHLRAGSHNFHTDCSSECHSGPSGKCHCFSHLCAKGVRAAVSVAFKILF